MFAIDRALQIRKCILLFIKYKIRTVKYIYIYIKTKNYSSTIRITKTTYEVLFIVHNHLVQLRWNIFIVIGGWKRKRLIAEKASKQAHQSASRVLPKHKTIIIIIILLRRDGSRVGGAHEWQFLEILGPAIKRTL